MSDKNESGGGCAETTTVSMPSQPGMMPGAQPDTPPAGYQGEPQDMQGYGVPQEGGYGAGVSNAEAPSGDASSSCGGASVMEPTAGVPVAGQPQEVSGQWHEAFHLKPDNGYAYQGSQMAAPQYAAPTGYPAPDFAYQGSPAATAQNGQYGMYGTQAPQYPGAGHPGTAQTTMPQAGMPQTMAAHATAPGMAPQMPYQATGQSPTGYAQPAQASGYAAMGMGGTMGPAMQPMMQPMMGGQPVMDMQPGMQPVYMQGPVEHMAQPAAPAGMQSMSGPAPQSAVHGEGNCKGNCSHHMYGGNETADMYAGTAQGFSPFALFGPAGEAFNSQFGQFYQSAGQNSSQPGAEDPHHLENKYGQLMEIYNDLMQGKTDPAKIMSFFTSTGTYFWKGALVGAVLTLILTNDSVKATLKECLGAVIPGKE